MYYTLEPADALNSVRRFCWSRFQLSRNQTKVITLANHNRCKECSEPIRIRSKYVLPAHAKREKTHASKSRLLLVLPLIGWESGASFLNQSQRVVTQNHCKCELADKPYLEHNLVSYALIFCGHVCSILKVSFIKEKLATMGRIIFCLLSLVIVVFLSTTSQSCDWRSDGCSIPGNLPFFYKEIFIPACNRHDVCYYCVRVRSFLWP